ncbi:MAG TPA: hypothetical protein VI916_14505 [Acidimicrobiia bacterium]|nr:hypothetical protein [Acidimicrobiia bacterium]
MRLLAQARGWHTIPANTAELVGRLLVNGRGAAAGRAATVSLDDLTVLREMAKDPKFWDWLATSMAELDYAADRWGGDVHAIALLFTADDIAFLRLLLDTGADMNKLRAALGPVRVGALEALAAAGSARTGGVGTGAIGTGVTAAHITDTQADLTAAGGLEGVIDEFGMTGGFRDGLGWGPATNLVLGMGDAMAGELWLWLTSPFESSQRWMFTDDALDVLENLLTTHADDLLAMGAALTDAVHALEAAQQALDQAHLDDPRSALGGQGATDLEGVIDDYLDVLNGAGPDWRDSHEDDVLERVDHVAQKLKDLRLSMASFQHMQDRLPLIREWLNSLRTMAGGSQRSVLNLFNPEAFVRLGAIKALLSGLSASGFLLDSTGPVSRPFPVPRPLPPPEPEPPKDSEAWYEWYARQQLGADFRAAPMGENPFPGDTVDLGE